MRSEKITVQEAGKPHNTVTLENRKQLRALFTEELKDIFWAERALSNLLPKLADHINSEELADAVLDDLALTFDHGSKLERIFRASGLTPEGTLCETMAGLIKDAERLTKAGNSCTFRDASLLSVLKRIRYYQIASYGILCSFARTLGEVEAQGLLETMLEEKRTNYSVLIHSSRSLLNG